MTGIKLETERKLLGVIEKTADLVGGGMSPNDAVVKAASDAQLRPGEVSLVVQAYNTGRTNRQRQDNDDIFSKVAEFELADAAEVLEKLYPSKVKQASAPVPDLDPLSAEYTISPRPMLERKDRWEKKATAVNWREFNGETIETPTPLPRDTRSQLLKEAGEQQRRVHKLEEARRVKAAAFDAAGEIFRELTDYFRGVDALPIPVVKEAAAILHGEKGEQVIDQLTAVTPELLKLATHHNGQSLMGPRGRSTFAVSVDDLDATAEPFPKIAQLLDRIDTYKQAGAAYAEAEKAQEASVVPPFSVPGTGSVLDQSYEVEKTAFGIPDPLSALGAYTMVSNVGKDVAGKLGNPEQERRTQQQVNGVINQLNDPSHELKLREINARASLQDLMLNDPVISGYGPEQVASAYNDIVQVSPSVSDQRMLMQTLLRKHLQQGQLDTFEQDKLLGFEDSLRKQVQPGKGGGDASVI